MSCVTQIKKIFIFNIYIYIYKCGWNIHPFTSDKLSSNLVLSVWLGTLLRTSVTFTIDCSTLLQEPVEE